MSETASANGYQVLERQPWPKSRNTDGDSLCGDYDVLSAFEDYCKEIQKVSINEVSETSSSIPSYTMVSEPYAWEPYSVGLGYNRQSATFKSTNSPHVAYVSLCKLLDPTKKYILIVFLRPPDHESHDPGEPEPTGVWIGTSDIGVPLAELITAIAAGDAALLLVQRLSGRLGSDGHGDGDPLGFPARLAAGQQLELERPIRQSNAGRQNRTAQRQESQLRLEARLP